MGGACLTGVALRDAFSYANPVTKLAPVPEILPPANRQCHLLRVKNRLNKANAPCRSAGRVT